MIHFLVFCWVIVLSCAQSPCDIKTAAIVDPIEKASFLRIWPVNGASCSPDGYVCETSPVTNQCNLVRVIGSKDIYLDAGSSLTSVVFPKLESVANRLDITGAVLVNISLPALRWIAGAHHGLGINNNPMLQEFSAPSLENVSSTQSNGDGGILFTGNSLLTRVDLSGLRRIDCGGNYAVKFQSNPSLVSLSFPSLQTITGGIIDIALNVGLKQVQFNHVRYSFRCN